ncbi:MAG: SUKH-4 family immunity protein [Microlunatus sp.]|nr:SUKH-4 family immunity protein [Microlunatus sp.]
MNTSTNSSWLRDFDPDEVRAVWNGRLERVGDQVSPKVSPATRRFLADVGLPTSLALPYIIFVYDHRLSTTAQFEARDLLIITDARSPIGLGIDVGSDRVYELNTDRSAPERLFNSNIAALVYFVGRLDRDVLSLEEQPEAVLVPAVERIWDELVQRDPEAMDPDSAWRAWLDDLGSQHE